MHYIHIYIYKFSTDFLQEDMRKLGRWLHSLEGLVRALHTKN